MTVGTFILTGWDGNLRWETVFLTGQDGTGWDDGKYIHGGITIPSRPVTSLPPSPSRQFTTLNLGFLLTTHDITLFGGLQWCGGVSKFSTAKTTPQ